MGAAASFRPMGHPTGAGTPVPAPVFLCLGAALLASGCACTPPESLEARSRRSWQLTALVEAQAPHMPRAEARLLALRAVEAAADLHDRYGVTAAPWLHNTQYHLGLRPRGLCYHWADDLFWALCTQPARHAALYLVVANDGWPNEHHALVLTGLGQPMEDGVLLDAWRGGGVLFFSRLDEDRKYDWKVEGGPWLLRGDPMEDGAAAGQE